MKQTHFWRKACAVVTISAMMLMAAACGKGGSQNQGNGGTNGNGGVTSEYTYTAEYQDLKLRENADTYNLQIVGDKIYYPVSEYGETQATVIYAQNIQDQKELGSVRIDTTTTSEDASSYVPTFAVRPDGGIVVEKSTSIDTDEMTKVDVMLMVFDADYQSVSEINVKEAVGIQEDYFFVSKILCDRENRLYVIGDAMVYLFDADLKYQGSVDLNGNYPSMSGMGKDGKVYLSYYDYTGSKGVLLQSIEFDQKALGEPHTGFVAGYGSFSPSSTGDILASDGSEVFAYDVQNNQSTSLFAWMDCDIMGSYVRGYEEMEDGRIAALIENDDYSGETLAIFTKVKTSETVQKKQITIASVYDDYELKAAAIRFNKQSSEYHINMRSFEIKGDYSEEADKTALANFNNAITTGEGIDLILVNNLGNLRALATKGVFEDLNAYLEQSSSIKRSDFLENLLEAGTVEGKLIFIPKNFDVQTYVGKTKLVGKESGWTMDDLLNLAKQYPDAKVFNWSAKDDALDMCLTFTGEAFIDQSSGKCSFDSADFKKVLEFVNGFPDEYDWDSENEENYVEDVQKDRLLLERVYMYRLGDTQIYPAEFGEEVTFIGFPTADGSAASLLTFNSSNLAIASKSAEKDGAWKFVEYYLNLEDDMYANGLPANKAKLEKEMQEMMKPQYLTNENGEVEKDENGQPISTLGSTWYGDWEYGYHTSTQAEMDEEYKIITSAKVSEGMDEQILSIIKEEAAAYFAGQKSVDAVAGVIQSRVQLYVNENR